LSIQKGGEKKRGKKKHWLHKKGLHKLKGSLPVEVYESENGVQLIRLVDKRFWVLISTN